MGVRGALNRVYYSRPVLRSAMSSQKWIDRVLMGFVFTAISANPGLARRLSRKASASADALAANPFSDSYRGEVNF